MNPHNTVHMNCPKQPQGPGRTQALTALLSLGALTWSQIKLCMGGSEYEVQRSLELLVDRGEVTYRNRHGCRTYYLAGAKVTDPSGQD